MREILFRGKCQTGEWVCGGFVSRNGKPEIVECDRADDGDFTFTTQVDPTTVGQFTGRTDKNSKRVFEGDILCADTGRRWVNGICTDYTQYVVVVYNSQKARFEILGKLGESHKALDQVIDKRRATVVGNIHDNPELLS